MRDSELFSIIYFGDLIPEMLMPGEQYLLLEKQNYNSELFVSEYSRDCSCDE